MPAEWEDGRSTAGAQSALVKKNEQLPPDGDLARGLATVRIVSALTRSPTSSPPPCRCRSSAAVQPLRRRSEIRHSCRQCRARRSDDGAAHPYRPPLPCSWPSRGLRRRRTDRRGLIRSHEGEAAGRRSRPLPVQEPAHGDGGYARRARRVFYVDASMIRDDHVRSMIFDLDN